MSIFTGTQAVIGENNLEKFSDSTIRTMLRYMDSDKNRKFEAYLFTPEGKEIQYTDGEYWWTNVDIKDIKKNICGFADGFVEHVLKRLEERNNGKG